MPYAIIGLLWPLYLWRLQRHRNIQVTTDDATKLAWLSMIPIIYIGIFSYLDWPGGLGFDMRYLMPSLPFLSIITAYVILQFIAAAHMRSKPLILGIITIICAVLLIGLWQVFPRFSFTLQEVILYDVPLIITLVLVTMSLLWACVSSHTHYGCIMSRCLLLLITISVMWSGSVSLFYDRHVINGFRHSLWNKYDRWDPHLEDTAVILYRGKGLSIPSRFYYSRIYRPNMILADIYRFKDDNYANLPDFISTFLSNDRPVYILLEKRQFQGLQHFGIFDNFTLELLHDAPSHDPLFGLARITLIAQKPLDDTTINTPR